MESYFSNKNFITLIIKWKYHIIIILALTLSLSIFFTSSLFIDPTYKSFAIVYPVNLASFSEESETEQMLQILQSQEIRDTLFRDFNMAGHYQIDTAQDFWYTNLNKEFESNVTFRKTEYESVKIEVEDKDREIASNMIDSIIEYYNDKVKRLHRKKIYEVVMGKKLTMDTKKTEIDSLEKVINTIRKEYGILDYDKQAERLTEGYIKLLQSGSPNSQSTKEVKRMLDNLGIKGGEFLSLEDLLISSREMYNTTKIEYELALQEYNKEITYAQVVTYPFPADKKTTTDRMLTILLIFIASLFMTIIVISIIESKKT